MLELYETNFRFKRQNFCLFKVVTCVADEGDSQGDDGVHEHPELQLLVSGEGRNDCYFIVILNITFTPVACQPLEDLILIK